MNSTIKSYPLIGDLSNVTSGSFSAKPDNSVTIVFTGSDDKMEINLSKKDFSNLVRTVGFRFNYQKCYQKFSVIAIKNLLKKNEFLQLRMQLANNLITEDDFQTELKENENKYLIKLDNKIESSADFFVVNDIVNQVNPNFDVDEVAELFSIEPNCLLQPTYKNLPSQQ